LLQNTFVSHVTTSETEMKLFRPVNDCGNYLNIISSTLNTLENIRELQYSCEIISGKFPRAEIKGAFYTIQPGNISSLFYNSRHHIGPLFRHIVILGTWLSEKTFRI